MTDYAVITTLNEEQTICPLIEALQAQGLKVVIVDDCSDDDTVLLAGSYYDVKVIVNTARLGIGPSLMLGWQYALDAGAACVVQLDAGGSHDPLAASAMLRRLDFCDMVIGSRFCKGAAYDNRAGKWTRPYMSRLAAAMCNFAVGAHFTDWTSGYRAFHAGTLRRLLAHGYNARMHGWQIEVLARANNDGMYITEMPIKYIAGRSSFNGRVANEAINAWLHIMHHVGGAPKRQAIMGNKFVGDA